MFRHRHQCRRWAARVLVVWLMGLAASLVHACLAPDVADLRGPVPVAGAAGHAHQHVHPYAPADGATAPTPHPAHPHAHPVAPGDDVATAKANCRTWCDKVSVSIVPLQPVPGDAAGLAPPAAPLALPLPVWRRLPVQAWAPRRDGVPEPPIPIAFLRLAL